MVSILSRFVCFRPFFRKKYKIDFGNYTRIFAQKRLHVNRTDTYTRNT